MFEFLRPQKSRSVAETAKEESSVTVEFGERLSKGGLYSKGVHRATVFVEKDTDRKHGVPLVAKHYERAFSTPESFKRLESIHGALKREGFKVPATLRADHAKGMTLMTDLSRNGYLALAGNNPNDLIEQESLEELPGFMDTIKKVISDAARAGARGYLLPRDSYFLLVPEDASKATDYVIGDFDSIEGRGTGSEQLIQENIEAAKVFLKEICMTWVKKDARASYLAALEEAEYRAASEATNRAA